MGKPYITYQKYFIRINIINKNKLYFFIFFSFIFKLHRVFTYIMNILHNSCNSFWFKKIVYGDEEEKKPWSERKILLLHECVRPKINGDTASDQFCSKIKEKRRNLSPLKNSAYINIKKTGGGKQADYGNLYSYLEEKEEKIHKQLKIISPEVVVICGTGNGFYENVKAVVKTALKDKNVKIFSAYHPAFPHGFNHHIKYFMDKKDNEEY